MTVASQRLDDQRQGLDRPLVNVVKQDNAVTRTPRLTDHAIRN